MELDNTVYALDSSSIDLCLSLFDWAPFCSTKAAIKLHTLLDLRGAIPAFMHISDGKLHDVNVLDLLAFEAGAFYVMDRGHVDFARLHALHQAGAFFVTRAKSPMDARRVYSAPTDRSTGVICDQRVMLNGYYSARKYPEHLRRICLPSSRRNRNSRPRSTLVYRSCRCRFSRKLRAGLDDVAADGRVGESPSREPQCFAEAAIRSIKASSTPETTNIP